MMWFLLWFWHYLNNILIFYKYIKWLKIIVDGFSCFSKFIIFNKVKNYNIVIKKIVIKLMLV